MYVCFENISLWTKLTGSKPRRGYRHRKSLFYTNDNVLELRYANTSFTGETSTKTLVVCLNVIVWWVRFFAAKCIMWFNNGRGAQRCLDRIRLDGR